MKFDGQPVVEIDLRHPISPSCMGSWGLFLGSAMIPTVT